MWTDIIFVIFHHQVKAENEQLRRDQSLLTKQLSRKISIDDDRLQQMEIDELWEKVNNDLKCTFMDINIGTTIAR